MADIEDVRDAIAALVAAATHPTGPSITGTVIAVYPGYPNGVELDAAMARGDVQIRVNSMPNMTTFLPVPLSGWVDGTITPQTVTASVAGQGVTFGGAATAGNVVQVALNRVSTPYVMQANDTPATIAAALAGRIAGASASGATLTLPAGTVAVTLTSAATSARTVARERSAFSIDVVAPTPALRQQVAKAVHIALSAVSHFTASDGTPCVLQPGGGSLNDMPQRANAYARTLRVTAIYDVVQTMPGTTVGAVLAPANTTINLGTINSVSPGY